MEVKEFDCILSSSYDWIKDWDKYKEELLIE